MLTCGKSGTVESGRIVKAAAVSYTVKIGGGPQALGGRDGLLGGVIAGVLLVRASVVGGAVKAKGHK